MDMTALFDEDMPGMVSVTAPGSVTFVAHWHQGDSPESPWSDVGVSLRLSQQPSPYLIALNADAAALAEQDTLSVEGVDYLITRIDDAGFGTKKLALMPDSTAADASERWR
jgi:hypothetical protein